MKAWLRRKLPRSWLLLYHRLVAWLAAVYFWFPANRIVVIGVTGTKGKTTVCNLIAALIGETSCKVGMATTANFKIGKKEWINDKKQTMLGRFQLQGLLWEMVGAGCKVAVIETSSEGIAQCRHSEINYDVVVFTNLTPEHIESHGSFEEYKKAKGRLFSHLTTCQRKRNAGKVIPKKIVVNADDKYAKYFLSFEADEKLTYGIDSQADIMASDIITSKQGIEFKVNCIDKDLQFKIKGIQFTSPLLGRFNAYNLIASIASCRALGLPVAEMPAVIKKIKGIPGRMELVNAGQDFTVVVDYAHEPHSFEKVLRTLIDLYKAEGSKLIVVTGSCGGGRDIKRQPIMGKLAAQYADYVIATNEDPYDDLPQAIIDRVAQGAQEAGQVLGKNLFKILDRREGIKKAFELANAGDVVLIAGKGSEPVMAVANGQHVPWDDRQVSRELLQEIIKDKR
ncbi:UDP-N-acetylmuramoyl-L-alanyl-D-glutamate--2,6-diaminopimelate ligase [Patescibacteria group bacterium]|nr:UDP-N-acetylmuramoyl-L-alanyl-D-glutamate--2,6-diaminopimelate ligase [Patescibacteria group bacterium]